MSDPFANLQSDDVGSVSDKAATKETYKGFSNGQFWEACSKCRGTGNWRPGYPCFACKGQKGKAYKTSPEARAAAKVRNAASKEAKIEAFKVEYPDVWAWMDGSSFPPAMEMVANLHKYGQLFDSNIAFARRMIAKYAEAKAAREAVKAAAIAEAPVVGDTLRKAFDVAIAKQNEKSRTEAGNRKPVKLHFGDVCNIGANEAKYPGVLFVNGPNFGDRYGRIVDGKFLKGSFCPDEVVDIVIDCLRDPKAAAIKYGQRFGQCIVCGKRLTANASIERAIGPICMEKMGW